MVQAPVEVVEVSNATSNVVGAAGATVVVVQADPNQSDHAPPMYQEQEAPPSNDQGDSEEATRQSYKAKLWQNDP